MAMAGAVLGMLVVIRAARAAGRQQNAGEVPVCGSRYATIRQLNEWFHVEKL